MATLGIDLGGTNVRAAVVNEEGRIKAVAKTALSDKSPEAVVAAIGEAARQAISEGGEVTDCGVGAAGQIQHDSGVITVAPNLGWRNVPLGRMLHEELGRPVHIVNDLAAAAWGELKAGAGRGANDLFVCFVGTGVGSALVVNGRLMNGSGGVAGEFGHTKVKPGERLCGCGEHGCLEAYVGGQNLTSRIRELLASGHSPALERLTGKDPEKVTPASLEEAALSGDPAAAEMYEETCRMLALAIANQVTVLNPARLILGGGVLSNCPGMQAHVRRGVMAWASAVSRVALKILMAELGDDSGIIGAAMLA